MSEDMSPYYSAHDEWLIMRDKIGKLGLCLGWYGLSFPARDVDDDFGRPRGLSRRDCFGRQ